MENLSSRAKLSMHYLMMVKKPVYTIQDLQNTAMVVRRVEKDHTTILTLKGARVFWPDAITNPFNKINSLWRIKPPKAESPQALHNG